MEYKIIVLGDSTVGKTAIISRYEYGSYKVPLFNTIGMDSKIKMVQMDDGEIIKLKIQDTPGAERYRSITPNYIKGAHGILLIYDVTKEKSFDILDWFIRNIIDRSSSKIPIILAGNKKDDEDYRIIKKEQGEKFAKENISIVF